MRVLRVLNQAGDGRQRQRGKRLRAIQAIDDGECCIVWVLASVQGQMVSSSPVQLDYSASTRNHRTVKKVYPGTMSHQERAVGRGVAISDPFLSSTIYSLCGFIGHEQTYLGPLSKVSTAGPVG